MTKEFLRRCGEAYGSARQLAFALKVDERTIRRWLSGESAIPEGLADDVATTLQMQADELRAQADRCETLARAAQRDAAT